MTSAPALIKEAKMEGADESDEVVGQCDQEKVAKCQQSCPKMISLEKLKILTPLQNLPKNVGDLGKLIVATGFESSPKCNNLSNLVILLLMQAMIEVTKLGLNSRPPIRIQDLSKSQKLNDLFLFFSLNTRCRVNRDRSIDIDMLQQMLLLELDKSNWFL